MYTYIVYIMLQPPPLHQPPHLLLILHGRWLYAHSTRSGFFSKYNNTVKSFKSFAKYLCWTVIVTWCTDVSRLERSLLSADANTALGPSVHLILLSSTIINIDRCIFIPAHCTLYTTQTAFFFGGGGGGFNHYG